MKAKTMTSVLARGVAFVDHEFPGLETVGHVATLAGENAAWFQDPERNIPRVHQAPA